MKKFKLNSIELSLFYILLIFFICSSALVIHQHYLIVKYAYDITRLEKNVARSRERIEMLKVKKARIVNPHYLEQVAGRGGYIQPRQEQIILLYSSEGEP